MNTKLTLTIEKEIIEQAKKYASDKGRSLSEMVENYFRYITDSSKQELAEEKLSPKVSKLRGVLKVDPAFDYRKRLEEARSEKHDV